jgi:hypothetical protein
MSFIQLTASDLRGGRHSWRVLTMLWSLALGVSVAARMFVHF